MNGGGPACPNCGFRGLVPVYTQRRAPVNSVVLLSDRRDALEYPRGDIRLEYCPSCAFATNSAFDVRLVRYGTGCEETQTASGTFKTFHDRLVDGLIERYRLRGGHVVEIGCGKGEFLELLCARSCSRGTGFDPAFDPKRIELPRGVQVRRENFTGDQDLKGSDLVCCKMTLEHIRGTRSFLVALRRSIGNEGVPVFIQVPDARRIYLRRAFWDIYYEHCSYFTATALANAFTASGYRVEEISETYDGQYLAAYARTAPAQALPGPVSSDGVDEDVHRFATEIESIKGQWRSRMQREHGAGRRVVVWGGGSKAVAFLTCLGLEKEVDFVVDINPRKHGTWLPGTAHAVVAPAELGERPPDVLIIMNGIYRPEIERELAGIGVGPHIIVLP